MITFEVEGKSTFPHDMLRYDKCWPSRSEDAVDIANAGIRRGGVEPRYRRIRLTSMKDAAPTELRWESFGWIVRGCSD